MIDKLWTTSALHLVPTEPHLEDRAISLPSEPGGIRVCAGQVQLSPLLSVLVRVSAMTKC